MIGMASGKQQVATGVESLETEINSFSKGHTNPKVKRFLRSLKSAIIQPSSEMIVHGKEVGNRGQGYGTEGPRSAESSGASGEGPRSRPQSNEDKAQRTQGTGNDKLEISVQPVTEQQQNAVGEQGKKPSTTDQSGGNAGQIRIIDGRSGKNTVFKPDDKSKSGGKIEQISYSSVIDDTNINVELDASKHSQILPPSKSTARHESDEKDMTQSSPADKSLYGDKQDHDCINDSENLQEQLINMKDKLDARQKELKDSHQQLNKEIEEKNQIKIKNSELEERDDRYQQQLKDYRVIKEELTAKLNGAKQVLKQKEEDEENMNLNYEKLLQDLQEQRTKLQEEKQKNKQKTENFESQIRDLKDRNNKLTAENQDLSRRYSEVASKMLNYNSPNIDDLTTSSEAVDEEEDLCMSKGMGQLEIKEMELKEMQSVNEQLRAELKEEIIQTKTLKENVQELSKTHGELWAKYAEEQARYLKEMNETTALKEALTKLQTEAKNLSKR